MHKLPLFCSISRAFRVQRPVTCYRVLNKSFSITTCRKFGTTSIHRTEEEIPPPPAEPEDSIQDDIDLCELLGIEIFCQ